MFILILCFNNFLIMLRNGTNLNPLSLGLEGKLRNLSADKNSELVRASVDDCVNFGRLSAFAGERFQGVSGELRLENVLRAAELTPDEVRTALTITTGLYEFKSRLHHGSDQEVANFRVDGVSYGGRFHESCVRGQTLIVSVAAAVRSSHAYQTLVADLKRLFCTCKWDSDLFRGLRGYFEEAPYLSFLVFQPIFLLVGYLEAFPGFSAYFVIPGAMLSLHEAVLSSDFVSSALRISEDVDLSVVKVAKFLFRHKFYVMNLSWFAISVIKDPALAGSGFDLAFGFIKERPLEFIRYSFNVLVKGVRNESLAIEAPKNIRESISSMIEHSV